ncbi:papain family cysteine protease [Oesophagostomum dentatum]|uniref:Papain family cysteine protease n=1 Tax=Oesophagostomum dentatum TaxID=61180 RepID=A0A0B1SZX0_OESDE|nr:papain family cysteine protease [Oesophagostomum dentatum]
MYVKEYGTCSGGPYNPSAKHVCKPYPFRPCGYHYEQPYLGDCPTDGYEKPECKEECQPGFSRKYNQNRIYVKKHYKVRKSVKDIQKEILVFGPVQAAITVYEDFYHYRKGIYWHFGGSEKGRHAVKIIGWGEDGGVPYWLAANSWSADYGEDGYFRILRGYDECGIESNIIAGTMKV